MSEHYAASAERPDYSHRFHVGNVGDVWKHIVWMALVRELQSAQRPLDIIDCHGGNGAYRLGATGEWTAGIGALVTADSRDEPHALRDYLDRVTRFGHHGDRLAQYPGSPIILSSLLRLEDTLSCYEIDPEAYADLSAQSEGTRFTTHQSDGIAALGGLTESSSRQHLCLIDPPWNVKSDWQTIPRAIIELSTRLPEVCIGMWYPIKSYTRVNAMLKELRSARLRCLVGELITTPLDRRHNRLNGSGICIVSPPNNLAHEIAPAGARVGRRCATHDGYYELHIRAWEG